jgi:uncharacterized protein (DUF736 family)
MNQKDNQGALFLNDKREKETQPNLKGSVMIKGVEYFVSAWNNTSKSGLKYISLAFQEKEIQPKTELSNIEKNFQEDKINNDMDFLSEIS